MITVIKHCIALSSAYFLSIQWGLLTLTYFLRSMQWLWYKFTSVREKITLKWVLCSNDCFECQTLYTVIRLNFWLMGPRTHCFPYQRVQLQTFESKILFNDKSAILLHPRTRRIKKNFASQRQMMRKRCRMRRQQNHCYIVIVLSFSLTLLCDIYLLFTFQYFDCDRHIYMTLLEQV